MLIIFVFYLHITGAVFAFTKRWQEEGWSGGILVLCFIGLIFAIGWTIVGFIIHFILPRGIPKVMDSDSLSLFMLTAGELLLYYLFFFRKSKKQQTA
jgi:hypothetical protein